MEPKHHQTSGTIEQNIHAIMEIIQHIWLDNMEWKN